VAWGLGYGVVSLVVFVVAWKLGMGAVFWRNVPEIAASFENLGENIPARFGFGQRVSKVIVDLELKSGQSIREPMAVSQFIAVVYAGEFNGMRTDEKVRPLWKGIIRSDRQTVLTNLNVGKYTLEAGFGNEPKAQDWCRILFDVDSSMSTVIPLDFVPQKVVVDLDWREHGSIRDGWYGEVAQLNPLNYTNLLGDVDHPTKWRAYTGEHLPGDYQIKIENPQVSGSSVTTNLHVQPGVPAHVFFGVPRKLTFGSLQVTLTNALETQFTVQSVDLAPTAQELQRNSIKKGETWRNSELLPGRYWVEAGRDNDFKNHANAIRTEVDIRPGGTTQLVLDLKRVPLELWLSDSKVAFELRSPFGEIISSQPERQMGVPGTWYSVVTRELMEGIYTFKVIADHRGREYFNPLATNLIVHHGMELPVKLTVSRKK